VRSTWNPPAHPKDERRRARPCPPVILPKSLLAGVRVTRRGKPLHHFFFDVFSVFHFPLKTAVFWPRQGPKNRPKTAFWAQKGFPKSIFQLSFGRSSLFDVFWSLWDQFSMIFRCVFQNIFRRIRLFFSNRRTFKVIAMDGVLSTFCVFRFSVFWLKIVEKID